MPKKPTISDEDLAAFHQAASDSKLLHHEKVRLASKPSRRSSYTQTDLQETFHFHENNGLKPVQGEEFIGYKRESIDNKTLRKLRKGQYNVEAILDLHGLSVEQAKLEVDFFLQHCLRENKRVVLIIHGKGHHSKAPILKNKLNHWLRQTEIILAFCSATPGHGSRGAIYVLLKNMIEEKYV
jgi:DNA-nicking Smr family endonuclease